MKVNDQEMASFTLTVEKLADDLITSALDVTKDTEVVMTALLLAAGRACGCGGFPKDEFMDFIGMQYDIGSRVGQVLDKNDGLENMVLVKPSKKAN